MRFFNVWVDCDSEDDTLKRLTSRMTSKFIDKVCSRAQRDELRGDQFVAQLKKRIYIASRDHKDNTLKPHFSGLCKTLKLSSTLSLKTIYHTTRLASFSLPDVEKFTGDICNRTRNQLPTRSFNTKTQRHNIK